VLLANVESQHRHGAQLNTHAHPFVERLIGTIRREYLDQTLFWTTADLENKLLDFRTYFNNHRTHNSLEGRTPDTPVSRPIANLHSFQWQPHCRALYQTPVAAWFLKDSRSLRYPVDLCKNLEWNHPVFACSVAPRFAAPMVSLPPYQFTRDPLDESEKDVLSSIAKLENDSNHASEEIGMFNRLTAIGEDVSLIREKLVEGKPVPELDLRLKRLSVDHNKTLTQIGESIAVLHAESWGILSEIRIRQPQV
jgi:hypothetical protein